MTKVKLIGSADLIRIISIVLITFLVAIFVAPKAPWVMVLAVFAIIYTIGMELLKFYIGIKEIREGKHTDIISIKREYE